jgi:hypothetical protein
MKVKSEQKLIPYNNEKEGKHSVCEAIQTKGYILFSIIIH